jgi:hypothetical protein
MAVPMDGMPAVDNWRRLATAVIPMQVVGRDGHLGDATHIEPVIL